MRKNKVLLTVLSAAAFVFNMNSAAAVPTIFSDSASFLSAIGGTADVFEDFNGVSIDQLFRNGSLDVGDPTVNFTLSSVGANHASFNLIDVPTFNAAAFSINGSNFVGFFVENASGFVTTAAIEFAQPIIGFAANFKSLENASLSIDGVTLAHTSNSGTEFFGFTVEPGDAFSRIDITGVGDRFSMDNVMLFFGETVPEPGAIALLGLGMVGLGAVRRNRRRKQPLA